MIALVWQARIAMDGVARMLAFREGWRAFFDVSARGVALSFGAALLALPLYVFVRAGFARFLSDNGLLVETVPPLWWVMLDYVRIWLVFPVIACLLAALLGRGRGAAPWIVLHNWVVLALYGVSSIIVALYLAGLATPQGLITLFWIYEMFRFYAHWRVAQAALGVPAGIAVGAAAAPILLDLIIWIGLQGLSPVPAPAG